uniref:Ig-like domain-containing protein n=1 Tax=Romanomermis culicivorax TaxID=13658 RepID=A0A915JRQ8_ROMCU
IHVPSVDVGINSSNSSDFSANIRWSNVLYIPPTQNQSLKCLELSNSEEFSKHSAKVVTWFRNGHILKNASEFMITDDELTLIVNSRSKALEGKYFCRTEWKNYGIVVSPPLFVEFAGFENHKHEKKQRKVHALRGSIAYVPCVAPRPKPSYAAKYWFVRNDGYTIHESLDDKYFLTLNGLQILISMNNSHDSGNYTCFVKNTITGIEHRGKTVHLLVSEVPKSKSRVKIVAPSQKQTDLWVNIGENITMECVMHGHPSPLVVWEKYGGTLPNSRHEIIFDNLLLTNVSKEDEGTYLCKAEAAPNVDLNEYSSQLPLIFYSLVVHEPIKTKINFEVDLKNEQLYHIQCESSSGSNEMSILFNGEDLLRKSRIVNVNTNEGGRKPRLNVVIHNVSLADGIYQCLTPSKLSKYIPNGGAIFIKRIISNDTTSYRDVFGENYDGYDDDEAKETDNVIQLQQKSDENRSTLCLL